MAPLHAARQRGDAHPDGNPGEERDADLLAQHQAGDDSQADGTLEVRRKVPADNNAGVCQRKDRHDEIGHPVFQPVFVALQRRHHVLARILQRLDQRGLLVRGESGDLDILRPLQLVQQIFAVVDKAPQVYPLFCRDGHCQHHTGNGCVYAGLQEGQPRDHADNAVGNGVARPQHVGEHGHQKRADADCQIQKRKLGRIEDGDNQHRADVVRNGQCGQEDHQACRNAFSQQGQNAERKGDIGGHGNSPAPRAWPVHPVEQHVDQGRHNHSSQSGRQGESRLPEGGQFPHQYLALDLQADVKEEDGHQAVVDPVDKRMGKGKAADAERDLRVPEVGIAFRPRGVRPYQGNGRNDQQNDAACAVDMSKPFERTDDSVDRAGVGLADFGRWLDYTHALALKLRNKRMQPPQKTAMGGRYASSLHGVTAFTECNASS